jgi:hypothetical protein
MVAGLDLGMRIILQPPDVDGEIIREGEAGTPVDAASLRGAHEAGPGHSVPDCLLIVHLHTTAATARHRPPCALPPAMVLYSFACSYVEPLVPVTTQLMPSL